MWTDVISDSESERLCDGWRRMGITSSHDLRKLLDTLAKQRREAKRRAAYREQQQRAARARWAKRGAA